ncbi:SOS response-associated peptidase [Cytobacillus gottheilii]|uniref:SOS response-associated peptidase n=1 Tax=Cytobacillus gottheilii TaxID=859144 RepID=UPI0009BB5506|nr:SOS response-associated peptidase [Cytobacillus gottheilii]
MCGRFTLFSDYEEIIERFDIEAAIDEEQYIQSYNIAPSQEVLAVINDGEKNRLGYLKWGLIPPWAKDKKIGYKMMNARAETLTEKQSFRTAYEKRRCLIIADSFYEWKKTNTAKVPMRIKLKSDNLFAMCGLWERWISPEGTPIFSCTIITTASNPFMKEIHERMPVILKPENEKTWLNPRNRNTAELNKLLVSYDEKDMDAFKVSEEVNSPKNNSIEITKALC